MFKHEPYYYSNAGSEPVEEVGPEDESKRDEKLLEGPKKGTIKWPMTIKRPGLPKGLRR